MTASGRRTTRKPTRDEPVAVDLSKYPFSRSMLFALVPVGNPYQRNALSFIGSVGVEGGQGNSDSIYGSHDDHDTFGVAGSGWQGPGKQCHVCEAACCFVTRDVFCFLTLDLIQEMESNLEIFGYTQIIFETAHPFLASVTLFWAQNPAVGARYSGLYNH
jgi:hypothetical protein